MFNVYTYDKRKESLDREKEQFERHQTLKVKQDAKNAKLG